MTLNKHRLTVAGLTLVVVGVVGGIALAALPPEWIGPNSEYDFVAVVGMGFLLAPLLVAAGVSLYAVAFALDQTDEE